MTAYTSGTQARAGRTVNHDPEPYVQLDTYGNICGRVAYYPYYADGITVLYRPRREFAVLDNPILAELRDGYDATGRTDYRRSLVQMQLGALAFGEWSGVTTHEERAHARRVLTLLAALAE